MYELMIHRVLLLLFCSLTVPVFADDAADVAFQRKDFATARLLYGQDRDRDRERWLQYSAQIVRCCTALGETDQAVQEFFLICRVDPQTTLYDCIPLPWNPLPRLPGVPSAIEKTAEDVLDPLKNRSPGPAAMLLAAGILSVSTQQTNRNRGRDLLNALAQQEGHAAQLATVMLWKQRIPMLRTVNDLTRLENVVEKIPEPYRAGPYFLLASAANAFGEQEKAVLYWMRLPILYPHDKLLVEAAVNEAAATLEKLGRHDQAARIKN